MKLNKLKGKNIILLSGVLLVVLFLAIKFDDVYIGLKGKRFQELEYSQTKSDYSKVKSDCMEKAIRWISNLSVDPFELNKRGMKGKKHFMEKLFSFYQLYLHTADLVKKEIYRGILKQMFKITENSNYHLMEDDETLFKRDIVSYVHACYLMEHLGFESHNYKEQIRELLIILKSEQLWEKEHENI